MKKRILSTFIFLMTISVYAFENQALTRESVNEHWEDISFWEHGISSKLIEEGYNYAWESIWDGDITTAWVEGVKGIGINEWIIVDVDGNYQYLDYEDNILDKKLSVNLRINNGFCKNEKTFYNNEANAFKGKATSFNEIIITLGSK